jgi:membrane-bound serine protease (ClpP class)
MKRANRWARLLNLSLVLYSLFALSFRAFAQESTPRVDVLTIQGAVTPIFASYIERGIQQAEADGANLLVIQLDTPGGSVQIMEDVVQHMTSSAVPIVAYVAPSGAKAASAGTFIVLAAHLAAMAPNTTIGAASPVGMQGEDIPQTEAAKVTNVLVAKIKGLSSRRGEKATDWAEKAVSEAAAATDQEALNLGVIDVVAPDLPTLLNELEGRQVQVNQQTVTIHTLGAVQQRIDMTPIEQFLHVITDPNIAFILLTLGLNGLLFELASPGAILPGIIGGICLLLGFYALGVLNVNYTGVALIVLAFLLFIADIKAPSHGVLTAGGIISFVLGALILFNTPFYQVSRGLIISVALATASFFAFAVNAGVRAQHRKPTTGQEGLLGATAEVRSELDPAGLVFVSGALWRAVIEDGKVSTGEKVQVVGVDGLQLKVRKLG